MIRSPDSMLDWCNQYIRTHPMAAKSAYQVKRSVTLFCEWTGRVPRVSDVEESALSDWILSMEDSFSARYIRNHRSNVLTVIRFAADNGIRTLPNERLVRKVKVPPPAPWAWSDEELASLIESAAKIPGVVPDRPKTTRSLYLTSVISVGYDTGLRKGDLFRIKHDWVRNDGTVKMRQHKTKEPHACSLSDRSVSLVASIPYEYPLKWTGSNADYSALWREACEDAGIRHGSTHQVRRTAATIVWEESPLEVSLFLGHRSADMWKHYVDRNRTAKPIRPRRRF